MLPTEVMDYYRRGGERRRLLAGQGRLEYLRTLDVLTRVLPPAPASVLAARVLRPGGVVVAATISRFASLFDGFVNGYLSDPRFPPIVERALAEGVHHSNGADPGWFTTAYFHRPDETPARRSTRAWSSTASSWSKVHCG